MSNSEGPVNPGDSWVPIRIIAAGGIVVFDSDSPTPYDVARHTAAFIAEAAVHYQRHGSYKDAGGRVLTLHDLAASIIVEKKS